MRIQAPVEDDQSIRLPLHVVRALGLRPGDQVLLDVQKVSERRPARPAPRPSHLGLESPELWGAYLAD